MKAIPYEKISQMKNTCLPRFRLIFPVAFFKIFDMTTPTYFIDTYDSPLGELTLCATPDALVGLWFFGQKYFRAGVPDNAAHNANLSVFNITKQWLDEYFAGARPDTSRIPLNPRGTEFQRAVWHELRKIPYGTTTTYGDIAARMGRGTSPRAVGGAVGRNPVSIIIPCHRVLGANGKLVGYAGGLDIKNKLLWAEGVNL